jgi:hypothetical protein
MPRTIVPIWRKCGLARTDWDTADQILAQHILIAGCITAATEPVLLTTPADPMTVLERNITAVLETKDACPDEVNTAAEAIKRFLADGSAMVVALISAPACAGPSPTPTHHSD